MYDELQYKKHCNNRCSALFVFLEEGIFWVLRFYWHSLYGTSSGGHIFSFSVFTSRATGGRKISSEVSKNVLPETPAFLIYYLLLISTTTYPATKTSVTGIAHHSAPAPRTPGSTRISAPLITSPLATDTTMAVFGCMMAWK